MFNRIINKIKQFHAQSSNERFISFLRSKGIEIGEGTMMRPKTTHIDLTRPSLIKIGQDCYMSENFTLLTHDWVTGVFIRAGYEFLPSSGRVTIGDNVGFGQNVMVLKGVNIGDNTFIGAGSIVTRDIPANSIAVGAPCKVIMTLDEFYNKRVMQSEIESLDYARSIVERFNRKPIPSDFSEEFPLFVSGKDVTLYPEIPIQRQLGPSYNRYVKEHIAKYKSFDEFINEALR